MRVVTVYDDAEDTDYDVCRMLMAIPILWFQYYWFMKKNFIIFSIPTDFRFLSK